MSVVYRRWQHIRMAANPTLSPPHNTYQFSDLTSFLQSLCMSLSVLRGLCGAWSSRYSCLLPSWKVKLRRHFASMSAMASFNRHGCLDIEILSENFSLCYYALYYKVRSVWSVMIAYITRTFHSVPAYYARSTTTVRECFIYCISNLSIIKNSTQLQ